MIDNQLETAELGKTYKDRVTGFEGVATGEFRFLNGCVQYQLERKVTDSQSEPHYATFDVQRLEEVDAAPVEIAQDKRPGGPHPVPRRRG